MRRQLIMGNWKMNASFEMIEALVPKVAAEADTRQVDVAMCPPMPYLLYVDQLLKDSEIAIGGQNISSEKSGAFTGEIAADMLAEVGCEYVLLGHSERRQYYGDSDEIVVKKFQQARAAGLKPVLCVGETQEQREQKQTEAIVARQLQTVLTVANEEDLRALVIAYEPVWAIGTGLAATVDQVQAVHTFLRAEIRAISQAAAQSIRLLYGGSLKPSNANEILALDDVDGGLIGGASLNAQDFLAIIQAAGRSNGVR